jgi:tetratricopeptide (TPR) repeat protein
MYAWLVTVIAAVFYGFSLAPDLFPGDSALLVAQHAGIDVFAPLSHILWGWMGNLFGMLPLGTLGFRWNLLSAVCGAGSCGLLVLLTCNLAYATKQWKAFVSSPREMSHIAGLTAGLLLVFCLPFQIASTIAHPATFELLVLLTSIWLLTRFAKTDFLRYGSASAVLFGISLVQYTTALLVAPIYFIFMLYLLWKRQALRAKPLLVIILALLSAVFLYLLSAAWLFSKQPGFQWAEMKGLGEVLYYIVQDLYRELRHGTPKIAIVLVTLFSLLPFVVAVMLAGSRAPGSLALLLITLAIGAMLFLNIRFAPWPMFGFRPLMLMPYVIAAIWFGYLSAFLIGSFRTMLQVQYRFRRNARLPTALHNGCFILLAGFILVVAVTSSRSKQVRESMAITGYAETIADQITNDSWLMVDGQLEPLVRIKAHEKGKTPLFLSTQRFGHPPYQNAIASQMPNDRLASMVRMGLVPLLRERIHPDHNTAPPMAIIGDPSLFRFIAGSAWPDRLLYWNTEPEDVSPDAYMEEQRVFWRSLSSSEIKGPFQELHQRLLMQSARIANDAGVWLQDQQRPELAREAYREAIRIDPANLSARLNARALMADDDTEVAAYDEKIEELSANLRGKRTLVQITDMYGQIRHDAAFRESKHRWNSTDAKPQLDERFETVLRQTNDLEALRILESIPGADNAMKLGMIRIAASRGRPALAEKIIVGLPETGPFARARLIESANIDIQLGQRERAYQSLISIPASEIDDPRILIMLALLTVEEKPQECDQYLEKLAEFPNLLVSLWLPIARIHEARGNTEKAAEILSQLHAAQPLNTDAMRSLIRIHLDRGELTKAIKITRMLLILDPRDPLTNVALSLYLTSTDRPTGANEAKIIALAGNPELKKYFEKVNE